MITVKEAAERLNISTGMVYQLCGKREIRHLRIGLRRGKILIPEEAIEEFCQKQTVGVRERAEQLPPPRQIRLKHIKA